MMGSGKDELPPDLTPHVSASLGAFVVERQRREGRGVEVAHNLVQAGDLLLQKVVLLLGDLLPLLRDLQSLQQLSVLHVQVVDEHVCLAVLVPLKEVRQKEAVARVTRLTSGPAHSATAALLHPCSVT